MKKNRFVAPDTCRLEISSGDWVEIKKELSVGDDRRYRSAGLKRLSGTPGSGGGAAVDVDWAELALARVTTYVVDWSFENEKGKRVDVTPKAIQELEPDTFEEIDTAIVKHIGEMAEAKKANGGSPTPPSA